MSFRNRLLISFSLLIAITFGVGGGILITTSFHSLLDEAKRSAIGEYEIIQNNLNTLLLFDQTGNYGNISEMLNQMEEQNMSHWQAVSLRSKGLSIYESGDLELLSENLSLKEGKGYAYVQLLDEKGPRLQIYAEFPAGGETLFLNICFDLSMAYTHREHQQNLFLCIYFVVVLLGAGIAYVMSYLLTKRLQGLTEGVREIANGDLSKRTKLRTGDEFEQLSRDFDSMTDKLQENILRLEDDVKRKESFMGAVAHELKTPMTSIIGYADLIRQCALDEEERMLAANYIYTEGQRLEKLSHKILDLLLMENDTFEMKNVPLDIFMENVVHSLAPIAKEKGIVLVLECEEISVRMEPDLGKSLFYNLIENAIKATSAGGKVYIKGRAILGGCEISIIDEGCGMEEAELSKITEAFYRVDKSRSRMQGGVGLGLTLCKKIVNLHHGNMVFQSVKGKGSTVVVELYEKEAQEDEG